MRLGFIERATAAATAGCILTSRPRSGLRSQAATIVEEVTDPLTTTQQVTNDSRRAEDAELTMPDSSPNGLAQLHLRISRTALAAVATVKPGLTPIGSFVPTLIRRRDSAPDNYADCDHIVAGS